MLRRGQKKKSKFITGEIVRVKSQDAIRKTFDHNTKRDGCLFIEQMQQYCGNTYKILKVVHSIFDEHHKRTLKTRSPIYILDGLICEGKLNNFRFRCDHSCFLLWHEDWLEKTEQLSLYSSRLDSMPDKESCFSTPGMCQSQLIEEIGYKNSWPNDKLQSSIRRLRWYRRRVSLTIWTVLNSKKTLDLSNDQIQAGDLVRVCNKADIKSTLNSLNKTKGCTFCSPMFAECGREYRVFKKVDHFFDEDKQGFVKCNGIVLLEGCYCQGKAVYWGTCDRNCFYFWRSEWLQKVT